MKSGIRTFPPPWTLRQSKGLVTINIYGNSQILAVGFVERGLFREYCYSKKWENEWKENVNLLVGPETKGVGVEVVSCYGDDLWKVGNNSGGIGRGVKNVDIMGVINPLGGGRYDDGNFGNVGFCEVRVAIPILEVGEEQDDDDVSSTHDEGGVEISSDAQEQNDVEAVDGMEQLNISDHDKGNEKDLSTSEGDANETSLDATTEIDHDAILEAAFYASLIQLLASKTPLPIPVSTYSAKYLMSAVPISGPRLDMKQTTYKKIGPFLLEMESSGVIKIGPSKDKKDKCAFLIGIEKSHPDLLAFKRQWKKELEESCQDPTSMALTSDAKKKKLAIVDLFIIPRHISDGMQLPDDDVKAMNAKTEERRGTGYLTKTECRAIIDSYIETEGLADPKSKGNILINGPLCDALYRPTKKNKAAGQDNTSYPTSVSRKELIDRWMSKMDAGHALVEMPGSKVLNLSRGEPKPVDIEVEFRQGNKKKFLTRIRGMEEYGVDADMLCNDVSTRFACSGTVETNPVGRAALKKGRGELIFQGMG
jgi:translation initiation factor 2D